MIVRRLRFLRIHRPALLVEILRADMERLVNVAHHVREQDHGDRLW